MANKPLKGPQQRLDKIRRCIISLMDARDAATFAGAPKTLERIRHALTSAQGAERNARARAQRHRETGRSRLAKE